MNQIVAAGKWEEADFTCHSSISTYDLESCVAAVISRFPLPPLLAHVRNDSKMADFQTWLREKENKRYAAVIGGLPLPTESLYGDVKKMLEGMGITLIFESAPTFFYQHVELSSEEKLLVYKSPRTAPRSDYDQMILHPQEIFFPKQASF